MPRVHGQQRHIWPIETNLCKIDVAGPGMLLHFNFQAFFIVWPFCVACVWTSTRSQRQFFQWLCLIVGEQKQKLTKHIPKTYQIYTNNTQSYIQDLSNIYKINTKYQAADGPARPKRGPSPGPRFILHILDISCIYIYICIYTIYLGIILVRTYHQKNYLLDFADLQ